MQTGKVTQDAPMKLANYAYLVIKLVLFASDQMIPIAYYAMWDFSIKILISVNKIVSQMNILVNKKNYKFKIIKCKNAKNAENIAKHALAQKQIIV